MNRAQLPCDQENRAPLYALGLLDAAESRTFDEHMRSCPRCVSAFRRMGDLAVELAETMELSRPPQSLRAKVLAEVPLPKNVAALVRPSKLEWRSTELHGVFLAKVYEDQRRGEVGSLVRMAPGTIYPLHHHGRVEHVHVMQGELVLGDRVVSSGGQASARGDLGDPEVTTQSGCLLLLVHRLNNEKNRP